MKKQRKVILFLSDIYDSIEAIEGYLKNINKKYFLKDIKTQDAVLRRLEIIGEAVKNIPRDFKKKHPNIPWKKIAGARDILTHEYFGINLNKVWNMAKNDAPKLKENISKIIEKINKKLL